MHKILLSMVSKAPTYLSFAMNLILREICDGNGMGEVDPVKEEEGKEVSQPQYRVVRHHASPQYRAVTRLSLVIRWTSNDINW